MIGTLSGRAWKFADNIDTDVLAPGVYMKLPVEEAAQHCLEAIDPSFARQVAPGDIVVAGANFGLGSSREQASGIQQVNQAVTQMDHATQQNAALVEQVSAASASDLRVSQTVAPSRISGGTVRLP